MTYADLVADCAREMGHSEDVIQAGRLVAEIKFPGLPDMEIPPQHLAQARASLMKELKPKGGGE